jgi:hypothetical protein
LAKGRPATFCRIDHGQEIDLRFAAVKRFAKKPTPFPAGLVGIMAAGEKSGGRIFCRFGHQ